MRLAPPLRLLPLCIVAAVIALAAGAAVKSSHACDKKSLARRACASRLHRHTAARNNARAPRPTPTGPMATAGVPRTPGLVAVIDPMTGGVGQATPDQLRDLAANLKAGPVSLAARPADPEVVRWADGTLVSPVPDRLAMFAVAQRDAQGKIHFDCGRGPVLPGAAAATTTPAATPASATSPGPSPSAPWEVK